MVDEKYSLNGTYQFGGSEERQVGAVNLARTWLLYGEVNDFTSGGPSLKKIIGMRFTDDGSLGLLKLPVDLSLCPILWYLKSSARILKGNDLSGTYEGVWGTAEGMPMALLQATTTLSDTLSSKSTGRLAPGEFEMGIFNRDVLGQMETLARSAGQIGMISLAREL